MAQENKVHLPGGFGGLMRYQDEYESKFYFKPAHVIAFIILIIGLRIVLPLVVK